ncbi:MAG: hypothetical protein K2N56_11525 [Oscillospiraceae bacterium]|nr:hypothetical protein [Oscillospiraceae bacterium]
MSNNYSLRESDRYNCLEGELYSPLFGRKVGFLAKGCDSVYVVRCAEYFETITADTVRGDAALSALADGAAAYILELIEENEFELGDFAFDEDTPSTEIFRFLSPAGLVFERFKLLDDEDCPIAFSLKMSFDPVPDECVEIALHGDVPVYAGEYRGVSPWNDRLLRKSWNYIKQVD